MSLRRRRTPARRSIEAHSPAGAQILFQAIVVRFDVTSTRVAQILDLFVEDDWLNLYAGELEVRPPGAPTIEALGEYFGHRRRGLNRP